MGAELAFEESFQFLKAGIEECTERIHPSAWKGNSANFALTAFSEVALCSSPSLQWAQPFR